MEKLNELAELAERADAVGNLMDAVNPHAILAIAEAFRELEEANSKLRQERAGLARECNELEAKLAELDPPKTECVCCNGLGVVYEDEHSNDGGCAWVPVECQDCLGAGEVDPLFTRAAPAADLSYLVPDEMPTSHIYHGGRGAFYAGKEAGWNACRAEMLRNIGELNK